MKISRTALLLYLIVGCTTGLAQQSTSDTRVAESGEGAGLDPTLKSALSLGLLETKIKATESGTDMDDAAKAKLTELYRRALGELQMASALDEKATAYKQALETAPARAESIREALASGTGAVASDLDGLPADAGAPRSRISCG